MLHLRVGVAYPLIGTAARRSPLPRERFSPLAPLRHANRLRNVCLSGQTGSERRTPEWTSPTSSSISIRAAMMGYGRGEHEALRVHLCSRRYGWGILAPPPHRRRRDGGIGASADRGQRCRLAVGWFHRLVKARKIAKARHLVEASPLDEACRLAKAPHCKACRREAGCLEPFRFESGRTKLRSLEIPD